MVVGPGIGEGLFEAHKTSMRWPVWRRTPDRPIALRLGQVAHDALHKLGVLVLHGGVVRNAGREEHGAVLRHDRPGEYGALLRSDLRLSVFDQLLSGIVNAGPEL